MESVLFRPYHVPTAEKVEYRRRRGVAREVIGDLSVQIQLPSCLLHLYVCSLVRDVDDDNDSIRNLCT